MKYGKLTFVLKWVLIIFLLCLIALLLCRLILPGDGTAAKYVGATLV